MIYLDMRGAGRSDWSSAEHWTLETWAADLTAFCETLELSGRCCSAPAIGGVIAVQLAAQCPELVDRLVLVSTVARYSHTRSIAEFDRLGGPEAGRSRRATSPTRPELNFAEFMRVCVPLYARTPLPPGHDRADRDEPGADGALGRARRAGLRRRGGRGAVQCPMLMLAGEDDPSTTIAGSRAGRGAAAGARPLRAYADTGHGVFRDRPEAIGVVREFLAPAEPA